VTHAYNLEHGLVPDTAVKLCTIHDYLAMVLAGNTTPVTDPTDAASLGLYDLQQRCFDPVALKQAGLDPAMLPDIAADPYLGTGSLGIPVFNAIGDNQASFLGSTGGDLNCMLANVGTGSQFSVYTPKYMSCSGLETRPFPGGGYLLVGASLCGGRAYALLEKFFRQTVEMATGTAPDSCYDSMAALLAGSEKPADIPAVTPLFQGTRQDPSLRGHIDGLSTENLTPLHLIWGMMEGMAGELHDMYLLYRNAGGSDVSFIGSGNGLRKNKYLQKCFSDLFGQTLVMSDCNEEAATGAAQFAASCN
jgi:sedoheptulokinase